MRSNDTIEVDCADTIDSAFYLLSTNSYFCIITDLALPCPSLTLRYPGLRILDYCKENRIYEYTKIIVYSAARLSDQELSSYPFKIKSLNKTILVSELFEEIFNVP